MHAQSRFQWPFLMLTGALAIASMACAKDAPTTTGGDTPPGNTAAAKPADPHAANPTKPAEGTTAAPGTPGGFGVPIAANKCPSAAPGSTTTVKETAEGVEITVVANGGPPINDIRQRGVQIVTASKDATQAAGTPTDGLAKCPIIAKDTVITETDIPGGALFTVKPAKPAGLADLKKDTKARAAGYAPEAPKPVAP